MRRITVTVLTMLIVGAGAMPASAHHSFDDVAETDTFHAEIESLANSGITQGCADRLFCPGEQVSRGQMAAFLHRALDGLPTGAVVEFTDDNDSEFEDDIAWLAATGVTRGCAADRFCPQDPVTRGQMAAFLHRALDGLPVGAAVEFTDDDDSVFQTDIEWLAATGVTSGCGDDRFCPDDAVTREQMAAFLVRALGLASSPLLEGRIEGDFDLRFTVLESDGLETPGDVYEESATYVPSCPTGPCDTTDTVLGEVYVFQPDPGIYSTNYTFTSDCRDQEGNLVVADGYTVMASERVWVTAIDTDLMIAAKTLGEVQSSWIATPMAVEADCEATGSSRYAIVGTANPGVPMSPPFGNTFVRPNRAG